MDIKTQIADLIRETNQAKSLLGEHWSRINSCVDAGQVDNAIPLLKAYFSLKTKLKQIEGRLAGLISANFSE